MKLVSRALLVAAVMVAALSFCEAAGAADVVVGPSLAGTWEAAECELTTCLDVNYELGGTGTYVTSPVTGAVVRFNVVGGETAGAYRLRTLVPVEGTAAVAFFRKVSVPVAAVPSAGIQGYSTVLPVAAGEAIGLSQSSTASLGFVQAPGRFSEWRTEPAENAPASTIFNNEPGLAGFNVEVQPAPTVTGLGPTSGPTAGGTAVTITGTDFENTTGVNFGSTAATSFTVDSEGQLTAVAPARATAGPVSLTVATVAGKANAPQTFTYEAPTVMPPPPEAHCVVPNLKGKKLKAAKKALAGNKCALGAVTKLAGATAKSGKVAKQGTKSGAQLPVGAKVAVTLKPPKAVRKKHGKDKH